MNIGIVGLGLIGGSLAKALRATNEINHLYGIERDDAHAKTAHQLGLVDTIVPSFTEPMPDIIILATPVHEILHALPNLLSTISDRVTLIDTGSTKKEICGSVASHPHRKQFVAAHPIAGTEHSGPHAATHGLFKGKINIICESEKSSPEALEKALRIFKILHMHTIYMIPEEHDKHTAYVSHLSHVSSFLLGQTVLDIEKNEQNIFQLAGSGFSSTVRLAKSSPDTWVPIFIQNKKHLSQALQEYIMHLQRFHYHLMKDDTAALHDILAQANRIKQVLNLNLHDATQEKTITPNIKSY